MSIPSDLEAPSSGGGKKASWTRPWSSEQAKRASQARHASGRRRGVDPTTCDRDYSAAELEFMAAMQEYKRTSGRMFPTWSEVLEVIRALGYEKALTAAGAPADGPTRGA
jgi:hypothetical protein